MPRRLDSLPSDRRGGELTAILERAKTAHGCTLRDLTVLSDNNDPYRTDTLTYRQAGEWFAEHVERLDLPNLHLRGYHYALIGQLKPDGTPYSNENDRDWIWLQSVAADGARWLGLIPFDRIRDQRNQAPIVRSVRRVDPESYTEIDRGIWYPPDALIPRAKLRLPEPETAFAVQPFRLAIFGEKVSLDAVLDPIAEQYDASLYLPTGEASDTMIYGMMRDASEDGRRLVVFYLSDCDPSGWQMAISVARKMQAFRDLKFQDVEFELHPIALTPDQVRVYGLPSTPLKETERRATRWEAAHGVKQTEIDALATLRPSLLDGLVRNALDAYYDHELARRVREAHKEWKERAQAALEEQLGSDFLERHRESAEEKLKDVEEQIEAFNDSLDIDTDHVELPEFEVPEPEDRVYGLPEPLIDSDDGYVEATLKLIAHKEYE